MKIAVDARTLGSRPSGVGMYLNDFLKVLMKYREFEFVLLSDVAESEYIRYFMEKGIPVITQGKAVYRSAGVYSYFSFIQKQLNEILAANTGQPLSKIEIDTERDNYMSAKEAMEYGLIDQVVANRV